MSDPRITAFVVALSHGEATSVVEVTGGTAVLNADYRGSYAHQRLLLTDPVPVAVAGAEADRVLGGAGLSHRRIDWLQDEPPPGLDDLERGDLGVGWQVERNVYMRLDRADEAGVGAGAREAEVVPFEVVRPAIRAEWLTAIEGLGDDVARDLTDRAFATAAVCDMTWHAVLVDGEPVTWCNLRVLDVDGGRMAQVEEVMTLEPFRSRGFARSVVRSAISTARSSGATTVWLEADGEDWPRHLYSRLGFDVVGGLTVALRST